MDKKQVLTEKYYGHHLTVIVNQIIPDVKLQVIPESITENLLELLKCGETSGIFDIEEPVEINGEYRDVSISGSWQIGELDHQLLWRIGMWQYNRLPNESLTEELFIRYYGKAFGSHFYSKWLHTYHYDFMNMITYFGRNWKNGQLFCDMVIEQVKQYEQREKRV